MNKTWLLMVGLLALCTPSFAQDLDSNNKAPKRETKAGHRKVERSKGMQEKGQKIKAGVPAVDLRNNPKLKGEFEAMDVVPDGALPEDDGAAAPLTQPVVIAPKGPVAPSFIGTPYGGLVEIERLARDGRGDEGGALAKLLMEQVAESTGDEILQAELSYAAGVSEEMASRRQQSAEAFRAASILAGPTELRLDSLYNQAAAHIEHGDLLYSQIEEVKAENMAVDLVKSSTPEKEELDTLPAAREQYLLAKEALISHLRIDWRSEDARANIEFVQQRLDKLDKIESKRDDATTEQKSEDGKESEKTEEGDDASKGDQENEEENDEEGESGSSNSNENQKETDNADPTEGEGAQDGDQDPNPSSESEDKPQAPKEEQQETGRDDDQTESEEGGAEADAEMSQEQVKLILDRLNELEQEAMKMRAALYKSRRIPVDRDW